MNTENRNRNKTKNSIWQGRQHWGTLVLCWFTISLPGQAAQCQVSWLPNYMISGLVSSISFTRLHYDGNNPAGSASPGTLGATRPAPPLPATAPSAMDWVQGTTSKGWSPTFCIHLFVKCEQFFIAGDLQRQQVLASWGDLPKLVRAVWFGQLRHQRHLWHQRQLPDWQYCQLQTWTELQCGEQRHLWLLIWRLRFNFKRQHCQLQIWAAWL